jgi:hypothetical protein
VKADWQTPGKATGLLRARLRLPAIDAESAFRDCSIDKIRGFLRRQMPTASSALEGATFVISAEIRAPKRGARWRPIARWRAGESIEAAMDRAALTFKDLPKEPGHRPLGL